MAGITSERLQAWILGGVGVVLVAVIPELLEQSASDRLLLALSVGGGVLLWAGAIWDDTICRRSRDERLAAIHYRAGYNTALALAAVIGTLIFVTTNLDRMVSVTALTVALVAGVGVYFGSVAWLKRQM